MVLVGSQRCQIGAQGRLCEQGYSSDDYMMARMSKRGVIALGDGVHPRVMQIGAGWSQMWSAGPREWGGTSTSDGQGLDGGG